MKQLLILIILGLLVGCSNTSDYPEIPTHKNGWGGFNGGYIDEFQKGHITYLIFHRSDGLFVVNYTQDSLDWEFLHQPTKTTDYGTDKSQTEQTQQSVRSVRTFADN